MKSISNVRLFVLSFVLSTALVLILAAYERNKLPAPSTGSLTDDISLTEQIQLDDIPGLKAQGYVTLIALRPDGEAPDQPDSAQVADAARDNRMNFVYIPVPHGDIPDAAVAALNAAIADNPGPILLYCRSGRRAARAWSLAEASRPDGLDAAAILSAARRSGQPAEDLTSAIEARIAQRPASINAKP